MPLKRKEAFIISAVIEDTQNTPAAENLQAGDAQAENARAATTEAPTAPAAPTFRELGVDERIAEALGAGGIITAFPIQAATIPVALTGADVIGQAKTGTGKTLAFGIPVLQRITGSEGDAADAADSATATSEALAAAVAAAEAAVSVPTATEVPAPRGAGARGRNRRGTRRPSGPAPIDGPKVPGRPQALIVVPTRELAVQVTEDLDAAGKVMAARVLSVYGGRAYEPQIAALAAGVDVVVGTPGRLLDLTKQGHVDLSAVGVLVLDEADEMLDLGFLPDVERIVAQLPASRQTLLFSATMPGQVIALARQYMSKPTHIRAADPHDSGTTVANITQHVYRAHALDKTEMLAKMLHAEGRGLTMVFCRTKRTAAKVAEELEERGFASAAVHGDLGQGAREQALRAFRNGKIDVLVATDVAARGIDVEGVTHVVNFQCPEDEKVYLHRIGRTGRAGASGTAVTFVDWDEVPRWNLINKALGLAFHEPPETYSTSDSFHADLKIPAGAKGRLLKADQTRAGLAAEELEDLGETGRGAGTRQRSGAAGGRPERTERPERAKRERTRTRGGRSAEGGEAQAEAVLETVSGERAERPKRERSRTRGGRSAETVTATGDVTAVTAEAPAEAAVAVATDTVPGEDRPKRSRTRGRGAKPAAAEAVVAAAEAVVEAAVVETPAVTAEVVVEKPKRTRTRKATAPAEAAEAVAEAVVETVVEAPAEDKPKRTRARKTAEPVAEVPAAAVVAEQPRRTRKPAAAAPAEPVKRSRAPKVSPEGLTATGEAVTGHYNS